MDAEQTTACCPSEFQSLVGTLRTGDTLRLDNELWRVISIDNTTVEVRPLDSPDTEIQFIGPSSGRLGSAVSTRNSGFSKRYSRVKVTEYSEYSWSTEKV